MGLLIYDSKLEVVIDDRTLMHLQIVIIDKLRRAEKFAISLYHQGHVITLWMTPQSRVQWVYAGNRRPSLNRDWLEALADLAAMSGVLRIIPEPVEHEHVPAEVERGREPVMS
ncbi:ATP-dependent DNA ligase [Agromyces sp. NPDC058110]|uniref:DUF7882 family protein n=1 Tax=Agromyces sp. NPDC058110 TaxID=3346345 RepID=UPI0036D993E6